MRYSTGLRIALALAVLAAIAASLVYLPHPHGMHAALDVIERSGFLQSVLLVGALVLACVLLLPTSPIILAAGFLLGIAPGAVVASIGAVLGAAADFLLARFAARSWIDRLLRSHVRFSAFDRAIAERGFTLVVLVRLCSLFPYGLTSYLFGLAKVPLGRYLLGSWLGRLPAVLVYAYLGSTAESLVQLAKGEIAMDTEEKVLLGLGLVALAATAVVLANIAKKDLREVIDDPQKPKE